MSKRKSHGKVISLFEHQRSENPSMLRLTKLESMVTLLRLEENNMHDILGKWLTDEDDPETCGDIFDRMQDSEQRLDLIKRLQNRIATLLERGRVWENLLTSERE